jgi:hypothetical protein
MTSSFQVPLTLLTTEDDAQVLVCCGPAADLHVMSPGTAWLELLYAVPASLAMQRVNLGPMAVVTVLWLEWVT